MSFTQAEVERSWQQALAVWDVAAELSPPEVLAGSDKSHWMGSEPLAYIDMLKRQVVVNLQLLERIGARDSLTAVLAHEVGHHVRFPHSLGLSAELELLQNRLIPGLKQSLTNLFFDLQVNEFVGRTDKDGLARVYKGFVRAAPKNVSELFFFYLAIYEELWGYKTGTLVPEEMAGPMEKQFPGCRAEARVFAQTFYDLPTPHLQFAYFCSRFVRYIPNPSELDFDWPLSHDVPQPSIDDIDGALQRAGALDESIDEARERGWLDSGVPSKNKSPLEDIAAAAARRPGTQSVAFTEALVLKHYARLVEKYLVKLPEATRAPEPELITLTEPWELGDAPGAIDWTSSVLRSGELAPLSLLKRALEPDGEPTPVADGVPAVEVYLDTSGSMPNPRVALNAMTLAALVLATSAIRRGARIRGVVYSWDELHSGWLYDERAAQKFLLNYSGGGTRFPFPLLAKFLEEEPGVVRVVISDADFLANVRDAKAEQLLTRAAERSERVVYLLSQVNPATTKELLGKALQHGRARLSVVYNPQDLAKTAAELADALIPEPRSERR